jgi:hypothetical protein
MEQTLQAGEEGIYFLFGGVKASTASCNCFEVYAETIPTASTTTVVDVLLAHPLYREVHGRGGALGGFGSVVNANAKVEGPLAGRLLRPRSNTLLTFLSTSMVTHMPRTMQR